MLIVFCEHCSKRVSTPELDSGKCKRSEFAVWCPACSQIAGISTVRPTVAEVAAIPPPQMLQGGERVSAVQAAEAQRKSGSHALLLKSHRNDAQQDRRTTTSAHRLRPISGKARHVESVLQNKPTTGTYKRVPSNIKRTTPASATERAASISGQRRLKSEVVAPAKDRTLIFIVVGAGLLGLGIVVTWLVFKNDAKQTQPTAGKTSGDPKKTKTTLLEKTSGLAKPVPPRKDDLPVVRPALTTTGIPQDVPKSQVSRPSELPVLDGQLNDACWKEAQEFEMGFMDGQAGRPSVKSTVRFAATEHTLYVGVRFDEPDMSQVPLMVRDHDGNAWADDCLELFFLPGLDAASVYYHYVVSVGEAVFDAQKDGGSTNRALWNAPKDIRFKVHRETNCWSVELEIPFASIPGASAQPVMRFNATRNRPKLDTATRPAESMSWSGLRTPTKYTPVRFGVLAFTARGGKLP